MCETRRGNLDHDQQINHTRKCHAAARALGRIGDAAAPALEKMLSTSSPAVQRAVCEGLLRCAEAMPSREAADAIRVSMDLPDAAICTGPVLPGLATAKGEAQAGVVEGRGGRVDRREHIG